MVPGLRHQARAPGIRAIINRVLGLQELKKNGAPGTVKNVRASSSKTTGPRLLGENFTEGSRALAAPLWDPEIRLWPQRKVRRSLLGTIKVCYAVQFLCSCFICMELGL